MTVFFLQMKDKAAARSASTATAVASQSNCDSDHHPPAAAQCEKDTSSGSTSRATDDTETSRNNIAELQRQLLNRLSKTEKSPLQRQKDTFADFMKEVTYTFPPAMWLRFQSEVSSLMQKYQYELHQESSMQTQQQQQNEFHRPCSPARIPGPGSQHYPSMGWQPHPSQWPAQVNRPTSVWAPRRPTGSSNSTRNSHSLLHPPTLPAPHCDGLPQHPTRAMTGNFTGLSDVSIGSFTHLLNTNQADDNLELSTPRSVVHRAPPMQQGNGSQD